VKICEIGGTKEDMEHINGEQMESVTLHIFENVLKDRKWSQYEDGAF
jgi:hypothetical protein